MRVLVIGASGMLGHRAVRTLMPAYEVWAACRSPRELPDLGLPRWRIVKAEAVWPPRELLEQVKPDVVVNAVGIVKQLHEAKLAIPSITVNALWPHVLAKACAVHGVRMVHVSTDCVFSGQRGTRAGAGYEEVDEPDPPDLYGRSKWLGEVTDQPHVVTLRTSIIGWQLGEPTGVVEWFAAHRDQRLTGYTNAVFSGLTTGVLSAVIRDVVIPNEELSGLYHVSAAPIDKYTLLTQLADAMGWKVRVTPVTEPVIDRSLDSTKFQRRTGWSPPSWAQMLEGLAKEKR